MTKKIKWVPNESGRISYDIIKVIFEGEILLKTKRPGEYILAIFPFLFPVCVVLVGCGQRERRRERRCSDSQSLLSAGFKKHPHTKDVEYKK